MEGDVEIDLSYHNKDDETGETGYFERAWFKPIPIVENGRQTLQGLNYDQVARRVSRCRASSHPGRRTCRAATVEQMHHTDCNTLHGVKRYHPSIEIG